MPKRAREFFEKHEFWISQLIFLALILLSLRDVLALPGTVGRTWDWEIPGFPEQIIHQISRYFFVWDYQFRGGFYSPYRPEGLFYFLSLPLALFGGEGFTKGAVIILLLLSANTLRWLTRRVMGLSASWSILAGALYMFSPAFFSRLMAGHLHMLTPYALLPLFFGAAWQTFHCDDGNDRVPIRASIATGVLFGLEAIHPSYLMMAAIVLGVIVLFRFFRAGITRSSIGALILVGTTFSLISAFWALPSVSGYLATGTLFHSGWPMQQPDLVTPSTVVAKQANLFAQAIQSVFNALRMNSEAGFITEYGYPVPEALSSAWLFASFILPLTAFAALLSRRRTNNATIVLAVIGLFGVSYVAGTNFVTGALLSPWLLLNVFPVWAQFAITLRMLPLVALAYAALAPFAFQELAHSLEESRGRVIGVFAVVVCAIFVSPFLAGSTLIDSRQFFSLGSYQSTPEDRQVYEFLKTADPGARVSYAAPPTLYNAQYYDLGAAWMGGLSPQPEFLLPYFDEEAWRGAGNLRGNPRESLTAKLLGLGAVEYLVFPHGKFIFPYPTLYPKTIPVTDYSVARRQFEQGIASQKNLIRLDMPLTETTIYRNASAVPRIYAAIHATLIHGNSDTLLDFVDSSMFDERATFFIDGRQPDKNLDTLASQVDRIVIPGDAANAPVYPSAISPSFLITTPLPADGIVLNIPRDTKFVARVRVVPYQFSTPRAGDTARAIFATPESRVVENWDGNTLFSYEYDASANLTRLSAFLDGTTLQKEYVQYTQKIEPLDLATNPIVRITSQVDNAGLQAIRIVLGIDFDGDGIADAEWQSQPIARANLKSDGINAFASVRGDFPNQMQYRVVNVAVRFEKSISELRPKSARAFYSFAFGELGFYRNPSDSQSALAIALPNEAASRAPALAFAIDANALVDMPAQLEYRVDGPATLFVDIALLIPDAQGNMQALSIGAQLLDPFADGAIEFDVRQALDPAQLKLDQAKIQVRARRLYGNRELRPTTLTITRLEIPDARTTARQLIVPPQLVIDGQVFALGKIDSPASRVSFSTSEFALSAGAHRLLLDVPTDAPYKFESLEIEPAQVLQASATPTITFRQINPTRFVAHVENARAPFFLVLSESYHAEWKASILESEHEMSSALLSALMDNPRRETTEHYRANGYANGWRITQPGSYDVVIEFISQRLYEGGWILSLATFFSAMVFLAISQVRRRVES